MSRVLIRQSSDNLRRSYLRDAVGTPARAMFDDGGGPSMLIRGQFDPSLEINYVDDPRLAVGETFTRATIGTTVDFEGRVLTCLSGEARFYGMRRVANLLRFSQDFTQAQWSKGNVSVQGSDPISQTKRPADRIVENSASSEHYVEQSGLNVPQGGTACVWATFKPGTHSRVFVGIVQRDAATVLGARFDLSAVSVLSTDAGVSAAIYTAGDGLLKCVAVVAAGTGATAIRGRFQMLDSSSNKVYQGDGAGYVWMREAQVEDISGQSWQGSSEYVSSDVLAAPYHGPGVDGVRYFVTDYHGVKIPRYTNTATAPGRCGLLRERASTNLCLQSADFSNASWVKTALTIGGSTAMPDGTTGTVNKLQEDNTNAQHVAVQTFTKAASALVYTKSVYYKQAERTWAFIQMDDTANGNALFFNLATGVVGSNVVIGTGFTSVTYSITPAGNGFFRCTVMATSTTSTTLRVTASPSTADSTRSYIGTTGSGIYAWGAQLEQLDHATSYIPTAASAVTRNKDAVTLATGAWFNAAEGTIAVEAQPAYVGGGISESVDISDGTSNNSMRLSRSTDAAVWGVVNGGVAQASITNGAWLTTAAKRAAGAYKANDFQQAFNGVLGTQDTAGSVPTVTTLTIGDRGAGGFEWDGFIGRVHYYPLRLPDAQLAAAPQGSI